MATFQIGLITSIVLVADMQDLHGCLGTDPVIAAQSQEKPGRSNPSVIGMLIAKTRTVLTKDGSRQRPRKSAANMLLPSQPLLVQN